MKALQLRAADDAESLQEALKKVTDSNQIKNSTVKSSTNGQEKAENVTKASPEPQNEIKKQDKLVKKEQKLLELTGEMGLKEVEVV